MSKGIIYRLKTFTDVTDELGAGADSVMAVREKQGAAKPYIVVNSRLDDPFDNYDSQTMDAYVTDVVVVSDLVYTEGSYIGAKELAEIVRTALHNHSGTYNGEVLRKVVFEDEEEPTPIHISEERREYEIMQTYRVYVERPLTTYTPISAFTYSNNPQVAAGAITAMNPSVTGDVNNYKIADSDLTNYNASGLSLDQSTGIITGTRTADASFEVIAVGKDGTLGGERVVVTETSADTTALTAVVDSGDAQTNWKAGQFADMTFAINAGDDDFTVSGVPTGLSFDKPSRTLSQTGAFFAGLSSGLNNLSITFTGQNGFTGVVEVDFTVTKATKWTPASGYSVGSNVVGFLAGASSGAISLIASVFGESLNATQGTATVQPLYGTIHSGEDAMYFMAREYLQMTLSSAISLPMDFWFIGNLDNTTLGALIGNSSTNYIYIQSPVDTLRASFNGTLLIFSTTKEQKQIITRDNAVTRIHLESGNSFLEVNGVVLGTVVTAISGTFPATLQIGARGDNASPASMKLRGLLITTGALATQDVTNIRGWAADEISKLGVDSLPSTPTLL